MDLIEELQVQLNELQEEIEDQKGALGLFASDLEDLEVHAKELSQRIWQLEQQTV